MPGGTVKGGLGDALYAFYFFFQHFSVRKGNIGHHDPGGAVGDEFLIHDGKPLSGFGFFRQICGNVVFNIDPAGGEKTEDKCKDVQKEE